MPESVKVLALVVPRVFVKVPLKINAPEPEASIPPPFELVVARRMARFEVSPVPVYCNVPAAVPPLLPKLMVEPAPRPPFEPELPIAETLSLPVPVIEVVPV